MLIEYRIKFEKDGLTISQHIEPNSAPETFGRIKPLVSSLPAAQSEVRNLGARNPLDRVGGAPGDKPGGAPGDKPGGAPGDKPGGFPGGSGPNPIFILGPIVFGNSAPQQQEPAEPQKPESPETTDGKTRSAKAGQGD